MSAVQVFWKHCGEKEKLLVTSNFSFSNSVFSPIWRTFYHFHQMWNCRLQSLSIWKSLNFVVWERVKHAHKICEKIYLFCYRLMLFIYPDAICKKTLKLHFWDGYLYRICAMMSFNSLPNDKSIDATKSNISQTIILVYSSKLKEFADDNSKFGENGRWFSKHFNNTEKEKLLVTSNYSFSHHVFKRLVL